MTIFSVQYLTSRRDMVRSSENALTIAMSELERNNWEYSVSGMNGGRNPGGFEPPEEFEQSENIEKPEDMEKPEIDENQGDVKKTQGQMMDQFVEKLGDDCVVDKPPKMEGRSMVMFLSPGSASK